MASLLRPFKWFYYEFGLASIGQTGRNAYLIILARTCRTFAYGANSLILALFFAELKFTDAKIGWFMTLTLVGDLILGTVLSLIADRVGRRRILFGGSFLMILTGAFFALFENFWLLLFAAVVGVVSATGGDFGPFRVIEESILSELTTPSTRSDVLAWYVTLSAWGSSAGSAGSGKFIETFQNKEGWTLAGTYHAVFLMYTIMGIVNAGLVLLLTNACEAKEKAANGYAPVPQPETEQGTEMAENSTDTAPAPTYVKPSKPRFKWLGWISWVTDSMTMISAPTRAVMYKLWALLAVDSLADGMVPYSLTNYYMDVKFHPSKATLGYITSVSYFLAAFSSMFAGPLAKKLGLVNTMVFTHIPSSAAVLIFPLPTVLWLTVVFFFIRTGLNNMDQAPRASLIAAVVKPEERTAVMGITTMVRTLAATAGPTVTGVLANNNAFWAAFVAAGTCRLTYDFGLYTLFVNIKLYQHESSAVTSDHRSRNPDEEMAEFELGSSTDDDNEEDEGDTESESLKAHK